MHLLELTAFSEMVKYIWDSQPGGRGAQASRKVRTPQGKVLDNIQAG